MICGLDEIRYSGAATRGLSKMNKLIALCAAGLLAALAFLPVAASGQFWWQGVRTEDLQAWPGTPVSVLETHPVFVAIPVVRSRASDGTGKYPTSYIACNSARSSKSAPSRATTSSAVCLQHST